MLGIVFLAASVRYLYVPVGHVDSLAGTFRQVIIDTEVEAESPLVYEGHLEAKLFQWALASPLQYV